MRWFDFCYELPDPEDEEKPEDSPPGSCGIISYPGCAGSCHRPASRIIRRDGGALINKQRIKEKPPACTDGFSFVFLRGDGEGYSSIRKPL